MFVCRSACRRYMILGFLCIVLFAMHYCVDLPGGLQNSIMTTIHLDKTKYNLIFSSYAWPNAVLSLAGGFFIDRVLGQRKGLVLASIVALAGQSLFATGATFGSFWIMFIGRMVFGSSVGVTKTIISSIQTCWFSPRERSFAMSLGFSANRIGVTVALTTSQLLYERFFSFSSSNDYQLGLSLGVGALILFLSMVCCIIVVILDIAGERTFKRRETYSIKVSHIKDFSAHFWFVITACGLYYSIVFTFIANGQLYLVSKFGFSINEANLLNALVFAGTILGTPLTGALVAKTGHHLLWAVSGTLIGLLANFMYLLADKHYTFDALYPAPILYFISYSFFAVSMWPLPSLIISSHKTTTAYGLATSIINVGVIIVSLVAGIITDYLGYLYYELYNIDLMLMVLFLLVCCIATKPVAKQHIPNNTHYDGVQSVQSVPNIQIAST